MTKDISLERYSRQMRFGGILEKVQRKLLECPLRARRLPTSLCGTF
jgi:molybdopterin/thiamine biosynthesis adenylyltransferase